jgi:hypothetical protein
MFNAFVEIQSQVLKGNYCTFQNSPAAETITLLQAEIYLLVLLILNFFSIFIDAFIFIRERGCSPKSYFTKDDPFGFRFQFYVNFLTILVVTIGQTNRIILYFIKSNSNAHTWDHYLTILINTALTIFYTLFFGCFGLIVVCIQKIQSNRKTIVYDSLFEALIKDKKGNEIFKSYSTSEWSMENILYFEDVEKYKNCATFKLAKRRAAEILKNYVVQGSPLEINISGEIRKTLLKKLNNLDEFEFEYLTIFDKSMEEVKRNMRDTLSRIPQTELKKWSSTSKFKIGDELETVK